MFVHNPHATLQNVSSHFFMHIVNIEATLVHLNGFHPTYYVQQETEVPKRFGLIRLR